MGDGKESMPRVGASSSSRLQGGGRGESWRAKVGESSMGGGKNSRPLPLRWCVGGGCGGWSRGQEQHRVQKSTRLLLVS